MLVKSVEDATMKLSHETVRWIAELAKLEVTDDEVERYAGQLSNILEHFERLQTLDTSQIEPTASVLPLTNVTRPDEVRPGLTAAEALSGAPESESQRFTVPRILDED